MTLKMLTIGGNDDPKKYFKNKLLFLEDLPKNRQYYLGAIKP